jgi:hypothetical protein
MLTQSQSEKVAKKCTTVLLRAVDKFQHYLDASDAESAAAIVADLLKTQVTGVTETDPEESIERLIEASVRLSNEGAFND